MTGTLDCHLKSGCLWRPLPELDRRETMALLVFQRVVDQYEVYSGMAGADRTCVPIERIEKACGVLRFELNEPLFDLVQAVTRWYQEVHRVKPKGQDDDGGENAAWVN